MPLDRNVIEKHRKVANLLASTALLMGYTNIIDRIANSLSIDPVARTVYEAGKIVSSATDSEEYIKEITKDDKPYIEIRVKGKGEKSSNLYYLFGKLPSKEDIEEFLKDVIEDIRVARIVAATAMTSYSQSLRRVEQK